MADRKGVISLTLLIFMEGNQFEHTDMLRPEQAETVKENVLNALLAPVVADQLVSDSGDTHVTEIHVLGRTGRRIHHFD